MTGKVKAMDESGAYALENRLTANTQFGSVDLVAITLERLELSAGVSVLDVACGNGRYTAECKRAVGDGAVHGVDQSESLIEDARNAAREADLDIDYAVMDACDLQFASDMFDRVACTYAVYHFPSIARGLDEMRRVCAPVGAKIVLTGPAPDNNEELYAWHARAGGTVAGGMGRTLYADEVRAWAASRGLRHEWDVVGNPVVFPSVDAFLDYYAGTQLFVNNIDEAARPNSLSALATALENDGMDSVTVTKRIGVFEIWI